MCKCKENNWVRIPTETNGGKYPMSEHAPGCDEYKEERFVRLTLDGTHCIVEPREVADMIEGSKDHYVIENVLMTRDQFERLPDFAGF